MSIEKIFYFIVGGPLIGTNGRVVGIATQDLSVNIL